jgi:hypothetical protein
MLAEKTQTADYVTLYRQAFAEHRSRALWNVRSFENPSPEDALAVARQLRIEGNMQARFLAEEIERVCSAAH